MAGNITDAAELLMLDWILGVGTPTRPTTPLKLALITTTTPSTDAAAGSEVSGGSYARQSVTLSAASAGSTSNSGTVSFAGMPACTVGGVEIWDSAVTPVRLWYGVLSANKTVNAGDTFDMPAGQLTISLD